MTERLPLQHEYFPETPVTEFKSAALNDDPLLYPGERPSGSFVTDGTTVSSVAVTEVDGQLHFSVQTEGQETSLNDYLAKHGAAPLEDRIPVLAYGANMCPASLLSKLSKVGRPDALIVPTIYAELAGHDVVWSGGPGIKGNFIASLYKGQETKDTSVQVGLSFLTREQLLVIHATELAYDLQSVPVTVAAQTLPAYFYGGKDSVYMKDGKPVAIESIPASGRELEAASTTQMIETILADADVHDTLAKTLLGADHLDTPEQYVAAIKKLRVRPGTKETPRTDLKEKTHAILKAKGASVIVDTSSAETMSWANPSTLPTYGEQQQGTNDGTVYRLPTSELPKDAWPDQAARDKVLSGLKEHFHRHFPQGL